MKKLICFLKDIHMQLLFVNYIHCHIKNHIVIGLFIDLNKAYDSISHKKMLEKLGH